MGSSAISFRRGCGLQFVAAGIVAAASALPGEEFISYDRLSRIQNSVTTIGSVNFDFDASGNLTNRIVDLSIGLASVESQGNYAGVSFVVPIQVNAAVIPESLTLSARSSNRSLVDKSDFLFGGTGAQRTLTIASRPDRTGTTTITIIASDGTIGTSTSFELIVLPTPEGIPTIVEQPKPLVTEIGQPASFSVLATGQEPLAYQWQFERNDIPTASDSTFTIPSVSTNNAGLYRVSVSNSIGQVFSGEVELKVLSPPNSIVYLNSFEEPPGNEWSKPVLVEGKGLLGQFSGEDVTLTITHLPPHSAVRVGFDLVVINTWDGGAPSLYGPDIWELIQDGKPILTTTFAGSDNDGSSFQSYPGHAAFDRFPGATGASQNNVFGFMYNNHLGIDSVYRFEQEFYHTNSSVELQFSGKRMIGYQGSLSTVEDESWALDNVVVQVDLPNNPQLAFQRIPEGFPYFLPSNVRDSVSLADKLGHSGAPLDSYVMSRLQPSTTANLRTRPQGSAVTPSLLSSVLEDLGGNVIGGPSLWGNENLTGVSFRPETVILAESNPKGAILGRFNRMILEDAYPNELSTEVADLFRFYWPESHDQQWTLQSSFQLDKDWIAVPARQYHQGGQGSCLVPIVLGPQFFRLVPATAQAFSDDFNRPDYDFVGNGWGLMPTTSAARMAIRHGMLTTINNDGGAVGIMRPMIFNRPYRIILAAKSGNRERRPYRFSISIRSDGILGDGYSLRIISDAISGSKITRSDNGNQVDVISSGLIYEEFVNLQCVIWPDGRIEGEIVTGGIRDEFSFPVFEIESRGSFLSLLTDAFNPDATEFDYLSIEPVDPNY